MIMNNNKSVFQIFNFKTRKLNFCYIYLPRYLKQMRFLIHELYNFKRVCKNSYIISYY